MARAALYVRVSTDDQTVANQEDALRAAAARMGHEIVEVYRDRDLIVKCAPGIDFAELERLGFSGEIEVTSLDGSVREACLWSSGLAETGVARRATMLDLSEQITDAATPRCIIWRTTSRPAVRQHAEHHRHQRHEHLAHAPAAPGPRRLRLGAAAHHLSGQSPEKIVENPHKDLLWPSRGCEATRSIQRCSGLGGCAAPTISPRCSSPRSACKPRACPCDDCDVRASPHLDSGSISPPQP